MLGTFGLAKQHQASNTQELADSYGHWEGFRTNHVIGSEFEFKDSKGSSRGISSANDLALMLAIRRYADLLLIDAKTARNEGYRGSSNLPLAIVSKTGNFHGIGALENPMATIFLFAPSFNFDTENQVNLTQILIENDNPMTEMANWCSANSFNSVLIEAGPTLTKLAVSSGIVNQSAVTQTGLVDSSSHDPINPFSELSRLLSLAIEPGTQYSLWQY